MKLMNIEQLNIKVNKLKNMSYEDSIRELDNIYAKMEELLDLNDSFINYKVLEILKQVYNEAKLDNIDEEYLKKYILLINDIQDNYELDSSETKDSPFGNNFEWNIKEERKEENNMNYEKIVNIVVDKIEQLPSGSEKSVAELIGEDIKTYSTTDLFNINEQVIQKCKEKNINISYEKYENKEVGLPFNIPFIKK